MPRRKNKLTPKQGLFVSEYLKCLNGAEAIRRSGNKSKNADDLAAQYLRTPHVREAIRVAQEAREARTNITVDRVLQELAILAFSSVDNYQWDGSKLKPAPNADPSVMRAVSGVKTKITIDKEGNEHVERNYTLWPKTEATKQIGQHLSMFVEKHQLDVGGTLLDILTAAKDEEE